MNRNYTLFISFVVALGGFLLGFDSAVISGAVNGIRTYFEMSDWELGFSVGGFGRAGYNILGRFENEQFITNPDNSTARILQSADTKSNRLFGRYNFGIDYDIDAARTDARSVANSC